MKYLVVPLMALSLFNAPVFANHNGKHKCNCDHKCMENCKAGHGEKCKCKDCDCAKTGKCKHEDGKSCEGHEHHEGGDAKKEEPKSN